MPKSIQKHRKNEKNIWVLAYFFIILTGVFFASFIHEKASKDYDTALDHYKKISSDEAQVVAKKIEDVTRQIYQNIWTDNQLTAKRKKN